MSERPERCLSVVMPAYNEAGTIRDIVKAVLDSPFTAELIIVDDGSTDGTREILAAFTDERVKVLLQTQNRGKGAALRRGFRAATARFVIVQDADLEYSPTDYAQMVEPLLADKADVVYGSRFHSGRPHRVLFYWHSIGNKFLTTVSNMFTNLNLTDMETCFKAFRREVIQSLSLHEDRFGIEPEITAKVAAERWRVYEVGISYDGRTYNEGKKIGWKDGFRALYCIVHHSGTARQIERRRRHAIHHAMAHNDSELSTTLDSLDSATNYANWIIDLLSPHLRGDILEIGSGYGTFSERLLPFGRLVTSEPAPDAAAVLRKRFEGRDVTVVEADAVTATENQMFDTIVAVNVVEHIQDDASLIESLASALRPGGSLALYVPAFESLYSDFDWKVGHIRRYRRRQLAAIVRDAGLDIVDLRYVNGPGALAWFVMARMLRQTPTREWSAKLYDRVAVPIVRPIESKVRPPVGQSVLCIARRPLS
ncbi:MAG: glycosyltransferase [Acidimicrobiia bacterium]